jgi:hypothetical protein
MMRKTIVTLLAAVVTGTGAAIVMTPVRASAAGWACGAGGVCTDADNSCNYGQKDQWGNCDISWPPPCPTCNDDCCVTGGAS